MPFDGSGYYADASDPVSARIVRLENITQVRLFTPLGSPNTLIQIMTKAGGIYPVLRTPNRDLFEADMLPGPDPYLFVPNIPTPEGMISRWRKYHRCLVDRGDGSNSLIISLANARYGSKDSCGYCRILPEDAVKAIVVWTTSSHPMYEVKQAGEEEYFASIPVSDAVGLFHAANGEHEAIAEYERALIRLHLTETELEEFRDSCKLNPNASGQIRFDQL